MGSSAEGILRRLLATALLALTTFVGASAGAVEHEVERGHSLWGIARRYGVSVAALRDKNGLKEGDSLRPGQKLQIPTPTGAQTPRAPVPEKSKETTSDKPDTSLAAADAAEQNQPKASKRWLADKPPAWTQVQKSAKERGVNPCNTPDVGFGIYDRWTRIPTTGQMIVPQRGGFTSSGGFDVMFHFHGHEAVRKEWVHVMDGAVLVGIDLGLGSGPYSTAFNAPDAFKRLVQSVEEAVAKKTGRKQAHVRKVGLSSWSAGYGAVQEIINQPYGQSVVDAVILLDGLHCGYNGQSLNTIQIEPFIAFARQAAAGDKFMFVSHSSIVPPGYASTTETANQLIHDVGGRPRKTKPRDADPMGLSLISRFTRGSFHVRGYSGNDKMDHCAHVGLLRDVLKVHIKPRWNSPQGRARAEPSKVASQ